MMFFKNDLNGASDYQNYLFSDTLSAPTVFPEDDDDWDDEDDYDEEWDDWDDDDDWDDEDEDW